MSSIPRAAARPTFPALVALAAVLQVLLLGGCASIMHGTSQQVAVSSSPPGRRSR